MQIQGNPSGWSTLMTGAPAKIVRLPLAIVAPIHPKAMPVILTRDDEIETWLTAPAAQAMALQRPLPGDALRIVARGQKADPRPLGVT